MGGMGLDPSLLGGMGYNPAMMGGMGTSPSIQISLNGYPHQSQAPRIDPRLVALLIAQMRAQGVEYARAQRELALREQQMPIPQGPANLPPIVPAPPSAYNPPHSGQRGPDPSEGTVNALHAMRALNKLTDEAEIPAKLIASVFGDEGTAEAVQEAMATIKDVTGAPMALADHMPEKTPDPAYHMTSSGQEAVLRLLPYLARFT